LAFTRTDIIYQKLYLKN